MLVSVPRRIVIVTLVCVTLSLFGRPAYAALLISATDSQHVSDLQSWYDKHIPAAFRSNTDLPVREYSDSQMNAYLRAGSGDSSSQSDDDDGDIDGVYEPSPQRITLRILPGGDLDMFTFAHEYGHYVWFNLMTDSERRNYAAIYKRQRAEHHLVTRYADTDLEEGFAEAFSFYANERPTLLYRDSASCAFLDQWEQEHDSRCQTH